MQQDLITPENLSIDVIKSTFDAAFMDIRLEDDDELVVKDDVHVRIRVDKERNRIRLFTVFAFNDGVSKLDKLNCVNNINSDFIMICASATDNDLLIFRYDVFVMENITKKNLVLTLKRFASIPRGAVNEHGSNIVE